MNKKLVSSLDWAEIETELIGLSNTLPMFKSDITRFIKSLKLLITELSQQEVEYRRTHSKALENRIQQKVSQINEQITMVRKFHLMSLLAQ